MGKQVKLERNHEVEDAKIVDEQPSKEELKKQLSQEEINVENSKMLRKQLKNIQHNDLVGFIILYNDHKIGKIGIISSIDQAVTQFVALAHGGYVDHYDQIISQVITTRTIERMRGAQTPPPGVLQNPTTLQDTEEAKDAEQESGEGHSTEETPDSN